MKRLIVAIMLAVFCISLNAQDNTAKPKNGYELFLDGRYQDSLAALESERQNHPERMDIYVISGWCYRELKDYASMERISKEGIRIQPTDHRALRNLASALYWQGKYSEAVESFDSYLKYKNEPKKDTFYLQAYWQMGVCYYNMKQWLKSDICFSLFNKMKPDNFDTIQYLAEVKEKIGEYDAAYDLYQKLLKLKPNNQKGLDGIHRLKNKISVKSN